MSTANKALKKPLVPPDDQFWLRYSPHHELPLAGMTSFFLHAMVLGIATLAGMWYLYQRENDNYKPPSMDVVQIAGMGDGAEGAGGESGLPGDAHASPTEFVPDPVTNPKEMALPADINLKETPKIEFNIPEIGVKEPTTDPDKLLQELETNAAKQAEAATPKKVAKVVTSGTGNPKGTGGQGGSGGGLGKGTKGTGRGSGGLAARQYTQAEIYANRWSFNLSGSGKEHVIKYLAMGVTVALLNPNGKYYFVTDLRRRPVELQPGNMDKFANAVKWRNDLPESLFALAKELKLPFVPASAIILLPKDREQKMADVELRYAQTMGIPPDQIRQTQFDFQLRGGEFEPIVIDMSRMN